MEIVEKCWQTPGHCILSLKHEDPEGFIDFGICPPVVDPRIYASVGVVKEYGRKLGLVDGELLEAAERRIVELERDVAEADEFAQAAEYTLGHFGERIRKKPGRKPVAKGTV